MSEGEQGKQGKSGQTYVVKADFTDASGRKWTAGTMYTGDEAAIRKAVAAGQVEQQPPEK